MLPLLKYKSNSEKPNYTRSQWAFPLVGIFIGFVTVLIVKFSFFLGLNFLIKIQSKVVKTKHLGISLKKN